MKKVGLLFGITLFVAISGFYAYQAQTKQVGVAWIGKKPNR
ncbi:MAG: hypothetical protein WCE21_00050 [Candidatus Babeliales bacterium]